ncbi:MAG: hypothetical protein QOK47_1163 [Actinomycetota bacterium]|nr:hypothetical protein [Actinomycetota bacterium]
MFRSLDRVIAAFAAAVFVFGLTFGVLSVSAGLSEMQAIAMSTLVFAGSSQFAVIAALSAGASPWLAAVSGGLLNLRLLPLGLAVAPALSASRPIRALESFLITDESVAVASRPDGSVDGPRMVTTGLVVGTAWIVGTAIGAIGGDFIKDPLAFGLDAAFPAGFIALLAPRLREDRRALTIALIGAAICLAVVSFVPVGMAPLIASLAALVAIRS